MDIGELINVYRKEARMTIDELVASSGVSRGTITKIISGVTKAPTLDNVKAIARALGRPLSDFDDDDSHLSEFSFAEREHIKKYRVLDVHGKRIVDGALDLEYDRMTHVIDREEKGWVTYINCYDLAVSAGPGEPWADDSGCKTKIEIPTERVPEKAHYCVRVNGDSMEPAYSDGDIVFVERLEDSVREGEIGIFYLNGSGYMKRLGNQQLISLNPSYDPIPVHDYDDLRCQGRVLGKV